MAAPSVAGSVAKLFEREPVEKIRELEKKTRQQIHAKQEEMRETVGARYRDIIESADSITEMKNTCQTILGSVSRMDDLCAGLDLNLRGDEPEGVLADEGQEETDLDRLLAVGTLAKLVLDTPAHIHACLDERDVLGATTRYLSAAATYAGMQEGGTECLTLFPWLGSHWDEVKVAGPPLPWQEVGDCSIILRRASNGSTWPGAAEGCSSSGTLDPPAGATCQAPWCRPASAAPLLAARIENTRKSEAARGKIFGRRWARSGSTPKAASMECSYLEWSERVGPAPLPGRNLSNRGLRGGAGPRTH